MRACIFALYGEATAGVLWGLYGLYRKQGLAVFDAWEDVLRAHLGVPKVIHDYWPNQERPAADGAHALYGAHAANAGVWVRGRARTFEPEVLNVLNGVVSFLVAGGSLPWRFHFSAVEFARYRSGYAAQPESVCQAREALGAWVLHYWGAFDLHAAREDARAALVCEIMETLRLRSQGESRRRADETVRLFESRRRFLLGPWSSGVQDAWHHYARLLGCDVGECS